MRHKDYCLESVAAFDKFADRYTEKYFYLDIYDRYLERFANQVQPQGAGVLDVACGPGNVSAYLAKRRPDLELAGIDLSAAMVSQARSMVPSAEFMVKDCRDLSGIDQVFDACAFAFGLSYLTDNDARRFFASLDDVLADTALLYLTTTTGKSWSGFETSSTGDRVYIEYRSVSDVTRMVERAGYRVDFQDVIDSPSNASNSTQDLILIAQKEERRPV